MVTGPCHSLDIASAALCHSTGVYGVAQADGASHTMVLTPLRPQKLGA